MDPGVLGPGYASPDSIPVPAWFLPVPACLGVQGGLIPPCSGCPAGLHRGSSEQDQPLALPTWQYAPAQNSL